MRTGLLMSLLFASACSDAPADSEARTSAEPSASVATDTPAGSTASDAAESDSVVVVFFGDSLTAGYGLANPGAEAYPALLGRMLSDAGVPARIINAGNSGETSAGGLRRADWVLARTRPDVFVLALGANDGLRGQDVAAMESNLRATLAKVRASAPEARLVVAGIEALPNYGAEYTEAFRSVFPRVAADEGADLVPFLLKGVAGNRSLNQADQVHPTAQGQRMIAETVAEVLLPIARAAAEAKTGA